MTTILQSVLFPKYEWSKIGAVGWLRKYGLRFDKVDETRHYLRYRQKQPNYERYIYRTKKILTSDDRSIKLIIGYST